MTSPEVLVDLGNVSEAPEVEARAPSRSLRRRLATIRYAIPLVLAVLLLAASAPALRPFLVSVADVPVGSGGSVMIGDDRMYVDSAGGVGPSGSIDETGSIVAYRLSDGRELWSSPTAYPAGLSMQQTADGTIVVSSSNAFDRQPNTEALDGTTGQRMWTDSYGDALVTGRGVLVAAPPSAATADLGYIDPSGFRLLDARTGSVLWSIDVPDGCTTAHSQQGTPTVLVEACTGDSTIRTIDLADGRTVSQRPVPLGQNVNLAELDPAQVMARPQLMVISGLALVAHANVPTPTVDAYALDGLATRWTGVAEQQSQWIAPCGGAICFYATPEGDIGVRFNVATGALIGPVVASPSESVPKGTLELRGPAGTRPTAVPDAAAGQEMFVGPDGTGDVWLQRAPGALIAPLPRVGASACIQSAGYLVCATTDDRLRVWRTP